MSNLTLATALLVGSFVVMLVMGFEISYALGISSLICCIYLQINPLIVFQRIVSTMSNFSLMAVPFFILMGEFMSIGGISDRLVRFAQSLVGWMRGGMGMVNVMASMLFGGISGSATADVASLGPIEIELMEKDGYATDFSAALTMASSVQGIIIPPSHNLVIYAVAAGGVSVAALFMGGYLSGIALGLCLMVYCYIYAKKYNMPAGTRFSLRNVWKTFKDAFWGLMTVVIVVVSVLTGWMTATEAAGAAAIYAFIVAYFVYKEAKWSQLKGVFIRTAGTISNILLLSACATAFSWFITYLKIPQQISAGLLAISNSKYVILLIINVLLLILGCFMNMVSIILIMVPILLPVVTQLGMSSVQFGIMLIMNLGVGLITPPVGSVLFVGSSVTGLSIEKLSKAMIPFYVVMVVAVLLITYVPFLTTWLPTIAGLM